MFRKLGLLALVIVVAQSAIIQTTAAPGSGDAFPPIVQ